MMDKELNSLLLKYKKSIDELHEISNKQETVNTSEKDITNNNKVTTTDEDKVNQLLSKLKLDVDTLLSKRTIEVENSKQDVQLYIDNVLWNLFSRTELNNNTLLFNNDPHRKTDKECLMKMITTLLDFDRQQDDIVLHDWLKNVMAIYTHICTKSDKKIVLQLLTTTSNISTWAVPLIQFNHLKNINDYIEILEIVFADNQQWLEDDYLAVLDQLAIDYTFNKLVYESTHKDIDAKTIFALTNKMADLLIKAIQRLSTMKSLVKLLSQTIIHLSIMLIDSTLITTNYQEQIDSFITRLVREFYSLKQVGCFFLPNIPFRALSTDALWDITVYLLQIKNITTKPTSLNQVLDDHLPCITRFQYELADNQVQGYFMLNCLTNIATCIPSGIDQIKFVDESNKNILSTCIVSIITYTLFTVAFIDKNLREVFYKDVRDSLVPICQYHTFVISLLFRWTVQHIAVMERMALYLFHSLDLNHWPILKDDLKLLHNLLSQEQLNMTTQHAQIQLAKYVIGHLNFGYINGTVDPTVSKSQPWHHRKLPFLSYDIHEEIAFILLDTCQKFQPLPDTTTAIHQGENKGAIELVGSVTSAVSSYLPIADQILLLKSNYASTTTSVANEMIEWAWSIALQLKLYDCPVSTRATEIEKSITLPFLKLILNSYNDVSSSHSALLIYISFLLSVTSRHFLRFSAGDGWMKLLTILKRGKAEAIIQTFSEIIPSFVYMHGDDFFNDDSLADFFKHMVELRSDPVLTKAAGNRVRSKDNNNKKKKDSAKVITTTGVGIIIGSHVWQAHLIDSVSNLLDESGHGFSYVDLVLHSWLKTVFRKSDWMWHSPYVSVIDTLCKLAFTLNRHRLVYDMLIEERKRMEVNVKAATSSSPRITRFIKTMIPVTESIYPSLLIGEWSVLNLKANTFNKAPGIETQSYWFAFEALVMETVIEKDPYRDQITQVISDNNGSDPLDNIQSVYKLMTVQKKPIEFLSIYRWLQHILVLPVDHVLLPLYLQMFFCLYYQRIDSITLGSLCFTKKSEWITKLRDYIASVQTYYSQRMSSGHTTTNAEVLQQTFYAMWLWLGNTDLLSLEKTNIDNLPTHYDLNRLKLCHGKLEPDQPWYHIDSYWMDLLDRDNLELDFLSYTWEGSQKFKADDDDDTMTKKSNSIIDDSVSLSTTMKRQRLTTGKSTMIQLPAISISDPLFNK